MPNASGTHLLQALALGGEELWQQEGRMPHCLKEGVLFLISIPRALSPERNKALAPHWTEHTASLQHSRGTRYWLKPWGQGAVTKEEKRVQKRKELILPLQKKWSRLCFITRRESDSPRQPFLKQSSLSYLPFLRLGTTTSLSWWP